ncbi:MAG: hypothetical protein A3I77_05305 [Gammaproteobacteria bacterium RIFCSPLOWO2_02_FULL_42_14]|nr:MAG: hypothetical protein A3B71_01870 [Gammaproteobacteria bacterium RIFCSPHIGHO2_02_FULL_42_43]OGT28357.1 MAG: hypothetical protein A2624_02785 [Gammaproteobacteria bacterium RIFCSPHIGHO2_01_FULL_42_8]OGT51191.1 MAG: hypothetical protein A3E54_03060 [Gammaproteobacteria bacterium RIFCSPHIGHO2_12_FULL_41_25]OGT62953.1 MAG: hypothetical protein A3I77_05305 [Gammaproteobacteria bacterium RIFCSPLOWO2_02_FULL_42_14]OGT86085.1 MAG: hypothetical protein A3G86_02860 [Gammaproteobacteria bacterium R
MSKNFFFGLIFGMSGIIFASIAYAQPFLIAGNWQTTDGKTHQPSSVITIKLEKDFYVGRVTKTYTKLAKHQVERCNRCQGNLHNRPIIGLPILNALHCERFRCSGGTILDPRNGKIYSVTLKLIDQGQWLRVHGFVGMPLLGRTVYWRRVA